MFPPRPNSPSTAGHATVFSQLERGSGKSRMTMIDALVDRTKRSWPSRLRFLKPLASQAVLLVGYKYRISYSKLISGWIQGFRGDKHIYYDFDRNGYEAYLSDFAREKKTPLINGTYDYILNDKAVFSSILSQFQVTTPRIYAENVRGATVYHEGSERTLAGLVARYGSVIVKPRSGSGGGGVRFVGPSDLPQEVNEGRLFVKPLGSTPMLPRCSPQPQTRCELSQVLICNLANHRSCLQCTVSAHSGHHRSTIGEQAACQPVLIWRADC